MTKKLISTLSLGFLLLGCEGPNMLRGDLVITKNTNVRSVAGHKVTLTPGKYDTTVQAKADGGIVFIRKGTLSVSFKVPTIKEDREGNISIPAQKLGQEFDLKGQIRTVVQPFDRVVSLSCVYDVDYETRCYHDRDGHVYCREERYEIYGKYEERQIGEQSVKKMNMNLVRGQTIGSFAASYTMAEQIHSRQPLNYCHL